MQSERKLAHFYGDHLLEPADSKMTLRIYLHDIEIRSSALNSTAGLKRPDPELWDWWGSTESYHEARALGQRSLWRLLVDRQRRPKQGCRKAIKHFTLRDRLKFTLRNALTGFPLAR